MSGTCETCKFHEDFHWACFNGNSPYCSDFTEPEMSCPEYEPKEDKTERD